MTQVDNTQIRKAVTKVKYMSKDEEARWLYDSRQKMAWDMDSMRDTAIREGMQQGRLMTLKNLKKLNMPLDTIATVLNITVEELRTLIREIDNNE